MNQLNKLAAAILIAAMSGAAAAKLPPPTPEQAAAQTAKKAAADAQAAKDKEALLASMDALNTRWRTQAKAKGWKANPPTPVAAPAAAAVTVPAVALKPAGKS